MMLERLVISGISAVIPCYLKELGDITKIYDLKGDEYLDSRCIKSVIKKICYMYSVDAAALRFKCFKITGQKNIIPIPLSEEFILVPFKIREPMVKKDPVFGYFNYEMIDNIESGSGDKALLNLKNGLHFALCESLKTALKHLNNARVLKDHLYGKEKTGGIFRTNNYGGYELATKDDIAFLVREIEGLINMLKCN